MKNFLSISLLTIAACLFISNVQAAENANNNPVLVMQTSKGPITLELYADKAPATVKNFLDYVKSGHYNGTIFHRVIKRFMIQGGGFTRFLEQKETRAPIINESKNGLHNDRWTLAMARTNDPDSASAQFFINVKTNSKLDAGAGKAGYAVFGMVTDGFDVVKAIEKSATMSMAEFANLPVEPAIIERIDIQ